jgi:hypothetical protein
MVRAADGGPCFLTGMGARSFPRSAEVAQLVEQGTENPRVDGSIPPLGTILFLDAMVYDP